MIGLNFTKMHGAGNDFIVIDNRFNSTYDIEKLVPKLCDRHFGIGADGVILVELSDIADIKMRIINADGSEAEMCGNGMRCFARYVYERGLVSETKFKVETLVGIIIPEIINRDVLRVRVNMGRPRFDVKGYVLTSRNDFINQTLSVGGEDFILSTILMGVPHTVIFVEELNDELVCNLGPKIERHGIFSYGTNVNFVRVVNENELSIRTWERGAGMTLACGTGACASLVVSNILGLVKRKARVRLPGGELEVEWEDSGDVYMTGEAVEVFEGCLNLKNFI